MSPNDCEPSRDDLREFWEKYAELIAEHGQEAVAKTWDKIFKLSGINLETQTATEIGIRLEMLRLQYSKKINTN